MSKPPIPPDELTPPPVPERRARSGQPGSAQWLTSVFGRPLTAVLEGEHWRVVLAERRAQANPAAPSLAELRLELQGRLVASDKDGAPVVMPQLAKVEQELGRKGWPGVEMMPSLLLGMALVQAEKLSNAQASPGMTYLVDRLRVIHVAAQLREEREAAGCALSPEHPPAKDQTGPV